jgi:U3 small nucleolar RNA-associated protein 11
VLKSLRQKAAERNEDEFYFGMMSRKGPGSSVTRGKAFTGMVDGDRGNKAMDVDTVRLLKTQDLGYIRTMRNVAAKEMRELEERFVLAGGAEQVEIGEDYEDSDDDMGPSTSQPQKPKKIVFFDAPEEREQALEAQAEDEDDDMGDDEDGEDEQAVAARRKAQVLEKLGQRLKAAKKKLKALADAEYELELQQAKMAKTATSGGITKSGRRLRVRERKR